jgi:hypothetical protein
MSERENDELMDAATAAAFIGLALATLAKMRCLGGGPEYIKAGRKILYRREDLAEWLNARRVANTTEAAISLPRRLTDALAD